MRRFASHRLCLIGLIVLSFGTLTWGADEENQPELFIEKLIHDFGKVFEQSDYRHVFMVKNKGKADLIIKSVKPG